MIEQLARTGLDFLGVEGVSVSVVALLLVAYLYVGKARMAGGVVVGGASRTAHNVKVTVAALLMLLLLGIVSIDIAQVQQYVEAVRTVQWNQLLERVIRLLTNGTLLESY